MNFVCASRRVFCAYLPPILSPPPCHQYPDSSQSGFLPARAGDTPSAFCILYMLRDEVSRKEQPRSYAQSRGAPSLSLEVSSFTCASSGSSLRHQTHSHYTNVAKAQSPRVHEPLPFLGTSSTLSLFSSSHPHCPHGFFVSTVVNELSGVVQCDSSTLLQMASGALYHGSGVAAWTDNQLQPQL